MSLRPPIRKRASHRLKRAVYRTAHLDGWLDQWARGDTPGARFARERVLHRLFPERRMRQSPFTGESAPATPGLARILSLVPPEDSGGASRPAQLAAELHRRGWAIEWRWALPIYPWPRLRRPQIPGVDARPLEEAEPAITPADLVLLEAPHPDLWRHARGEEQNGPLVYDAIDLWDGDLGAGWYDRTVEDDVLRNADLLVASARRLQEEIVDRVGRPVALLPNAVDANRFDPRSSPLPLQRGRPTVLYVGALWGTWVDLDLIAHLARALPEAAIHLVGPAGGRVLPSAPNIHIHGPRPWEDIPGLLAAADVAIIPFEPSRLSDAVSPLKVFEYLAMQRPVVATRMPELDGLPGVTTATEPEEFARAVRSAGRAEPDLEAIASFVSENTWTRRVDRLLELNRSIRR